MHYAPALRGPLHELMGVGVLLINELIPRQLYQQASVINAPASI